MDETQKRLGRVGRFHRMWLRTNPEGLRKLAGGETPGPNPKPDRTPEGCWNLVRRPIFRHPSGVRAFLFRVPGVLPPANFRHPFGMLEKRSMSLQTRPRPWSAAGCRPSEDVLDNSALIPESVQVHGVFITAPAGTSSSTRTVSAPATASFAALSQPTNPLLVT